MTNKIKPLILGDSHFAADFNSSKMKMVMEQIQKQMAINSQVFVSHDPPSCHKCTGKEQHTCAVPNDIKAILNCIMPDDRMETSKYSTRIDIFFPSHVINIYHNDILVRQYNAEGYAVKTFFEGKDSFKIDDDERQSVLACVKNLHNKYMNKGQSRILEDHNVIFYYDSLTGSEL